MSEKIKLVVFDKDGTLIDNTLMFGKWTTKLIAKLACIYPSLLERIPNTPTIWDYLGYDYKTNIFNANSIVAKGTNDDIRNAICDYIVNVKKIVKCKTNQDRNIVVNRLRQEWFDIEVSKSTIKPCGNIRAVFEYLKMKNIKIAICTSDDRKPTEETLKILNVKVSTKRHQPNMLENSIEKKAKKILYNNSENNSENIKINIEEVGNNLNHIDRQESFEIDYLVCGNDMIASKPSPEPLLEICKKLNVKPENSIMVGDTIADIHAGINAKFASVVGVKSGDYCDSDFSEADYTIDNINDLAKVFLALDCTEQIEYGEL